LLKVVGKQKSAGMGYKWHLGSLVNHESKFHPLPATGFLSSNSARLGGGSFAFQNSGVVSRRGGVATFGSGVPVKSGGVTIRSSGADIRFSGAPSRISGVANRDSGVPIRTSGVRFRFGGVSLQTSGVSSKISGFALKSAKTANSPIFTTDEHRWTQIAGMARHSVRAGLGNPPPAAAKALFYQCLSVVSLSTPNCKPPN
jgi:hypothetical protein